MSWGITVIAQTRQDLGAVTTPQVTPVARRRAATGEAQGQEDLSLRFVSPSLGSLQAAVGGTVLEVVQPWACGHGTP